MCTINVASSLNAIDFDIVRNYYYENIGYQKKHSEEAKQKMSESKKGKNIQKNPNKKYLKRKKVQLNQKCQKSLK